MRRWRNGLTVTSRDLVALPAFKGLDANEIGADIRDGREQTLPSKGRIQMSKTNYLQIAISDLQHTAGPYRSANRDHSHRSKIALDSITSEAAAPTSVIG